MNKEEIVHYVQLEDGRTVIVESLIKEIELSRNDKTRVEADIEYWQKEAQNKNLFEKENIVLKIDKNNLQSQLDKANDKLKKYENPDDMTLFYLWCNEKVKEENENLRSTIKNDDIAVNKLCEEVKMLKEKLKDAEEYIKFLVIFNQTINGKFSETIWGQELLEIVGDEK